MKTLTRLSICALLLLTGCTSTAVDGYSMNLAGPQAVEVTLPDGRVVTCVSMSSNGGIDCDWENAR